MPNPIGHFERVRALATSPRLLAVAGVRAGARSNVTIFDHVSDSAQLSIEVPAHVLALAFAGESLFVGGLDGQLRIVNPSTGQITKTVKAHEGAVTAIAVHGERVATAGADGVVKLWTFEGANKGTHAFSGRPLRAVAFEPTGAQIAAAGDDGVVRVLTLADNARREMSGHDGGVSCLVFTPSDGRLVSGGEDGTIRIWYLVGEVESDVRGKDESGHAGGVLAVMFAPAKEASDQGERIVSAGMDGNVRVWRVSERRKPRTLEVGEPVYALAFAPGTKKSFGALLAAGDRRIVFGFPLEPTGAPTDQTLRYEHGFTVLAEALGAQARPKREETVKKLAALDETEALELALKALASDRDAEVRALAATELAAKGRRDARAGLRDRLDDAHATVRKAAFDGLVVLEKQTPLAPLRAALDSKFADVRAMSVRALADLVESSPLAGGLVAARVADADAQVRRAAVAELVRIHPKKSVEPLRVAFDRGPADVRAEVLVRAAESNLVGQPELDPIVGRALDDADADVRRLAFVTLVLTRPDLAAWLDQKDEAFGRAVLDLLRRVVQLDGAAAEPTEDQLKAARSKLVKAGAGKDIDEKGREPLLAALACRMPDTALRGARGLAFLGDLRALGALLTISREADPQLRREAAGALVATGDPRAKKRLAWMLSDGDAGVRDAALASLAKLEPGPLDLAESALRAAQEDVRVRGLDVLVKQGKGDARAEALLGDSLEDEAPKVRGEAFRTLWAWHDSDPFVPLDRALSARFPDLRSRAVTELASMAEKKDAAALERLLKAIADRDASVAKQAYEAGVKVKGKEDADAHLAAIASTHATLRTDGAKGSEKTQAEKVRSALMKLLEDNEQPVRTAALEALDKLLPKESGPMYAGLQSSHLDLRVRAAELLAIRRDEQLIEPMRGLIADKELELRMPKEVLIALRRRAATALASLGSTRLLKYFGTELIKDEDPMVREQAARGLSNASRRGEEGYLLDALGHEEIAVRSWAAEGLARLGDVRALPVLTGTLRHDHPPIRVGAILSFAALGPEGYGGLLQGLEDPAREVQHIVLTVILARDLRAFRKGEGPELLTSALSSQRPEVRFAAARALELRIDPEHYLAHLVEVLMPPKPEKAADMQNWPSEEQRGAMMVGLAEALAGDRPEQRYAAAQALRLRERPLDYFRETERAVRPRSAGKPWVPETTPRAPEPAPEKTPKGPLAWLRRLFATGVADDAPAEHKQPSVSADEQSRLRLLAFGAYVGLLRQASSDEEAHRVRRDAIDRIVELTTAKQVSIASATPALARALDDDNHLVRKAAFAALKKVYADDAETPLALALASASSDVARGALDELFARGEAAKPRIASALNSKIPDARKYAFELLEKLSPKGSLEPLIAALASEHADIRIGVLEKLSTSQDPRVLAALGKALESDHDDLRLRAAEMLAARKDDRCVDVLAGLLRDADAGIVDRATDALIRLGSAAAARALAARLEDAPPDDVRLSVVHALGRFRVAEAIDALAGRFADESEGVRNAAFDGCLTIVGPRSDAKREHGTPPPRKRDAKLAATFLAAAARAKSPELRLAAAGQLDELEDASAEALLIGLFGDRDARVRGASVLAYAKRVDKKNAPVAPLEDVLKAGARETMLAAAEGLASKQIGAAFRGLLLYVRAGEEGERERALLALGTLGDPRALAELETVAAGGTEEAPVEPPMKAAAIEALGRLYGKLKDADERERVRDRVEATVGNKEPGLAVAAVKALRWVGGERSRARIEAVLTNRSSATDEKVASAEVLGEMGDPAAEQALAKALDDWDEDVRWTARGALEKLFPGERTRIEFHAVGSDYDDMSGPASTFLAAEGDPGLLLGRLGALRDDDLRARLRYGLVRRPSIPSADVAKLLSEGTAAARGDAAWLIGARSVEGHAHGDLGGALAEAAKKAAKGFAAARKAGDDDERSAEERAWEQALWAARRVGKGDTVAAEARKLLGDREVPTCVRIQAAFALGEHGGAGDKDLLAKSLRDANVELRPAVSAALAMRGLDPLGVKGPVLDPVQLGRVASSKPIPDGALATDEGRRIHLARAIHERDLEALLEMAKDGEGQDRIDAIAALGRASGDEAIEALEEMAFDKEGTKEDVRKAAYRALRRAKRIADKKEATP